MQSNDPVGVALDAALASIAEALVQIQRAVNARAADVAPAPSARAGELHAAGAPPG